MDILTCARSSCLAGVSSLALTRILDTRYRLLLSHTGAVIKPFVGKSAFEDFPIWEANCFFLPLVPTLCIPGCEMSACLLGEADLWLIPLPWYSLPSSNLTELWKMHENGLFAEDLPWFTMIYPQKWWISLDFPRKTGAFRGVWSQNAMPCRCFWPTEAPPPAPRTTRARRCGGTPGSWAPWIPALGRSLASPTILGAGSAWIGEPPGSGMDQGWIWIGMGHVGVRSKIAKWGLQIRRPTLGKLLPIQVPCIYGTVCNSFKRWDFRVHGIHPMVTLSGRHWDHHRWWSDFGCGEVCRLWLWSNPWRTSIGIHLGRHWIRWESWPLAKLRMLSDFAIATMYI